MGAGPREAVSFPHQSSSRLERESLRRFNEIREEEARRIARSLHDDSAQMLLAVYLELQDLERNMPPAPRRQLGKVLVSLDDVQRRLRHLAHELAPPLLAEKGLKSALRYLLRGAAERYRLPVRLRCSACLPLSGAVETAVYRIVQEAVANACRHARASCIRVNVGGDARTLRLSVVDDGEGFDPCAGGAAWRSGLGLTSIRERAESLEGEARILSSPAGGTTVLVRIPLRRPVRRESPEPVRGGHLTAGAGI